MAEQSVEKFPMFPVCCKTIRTELYHFSDESLYDKNCSNNIEIKESPKVQ